MKNETVKTGMKIGTTVGGLVFLVFGIMPGFYFGSFGTLILLQKLMGGTVEPTLIARSLIVWESWSGSPARRRHASWSAAFSVRHWVMSFQRPRP